MKDKILMPLAITRLGLMIMHMAAGMLLIFVCKGLLGKQWHQRNSGMVVIRWWSKACCLIIGLRTRNTGTIRHGLTVANHISWLDIIVLNSLSTHRFVSKDDVLRWPLIGRLAAGSGTFFLNRKSPRAASRCLQQVTDTLKNGNRALFFPEGTTSDGKQVLAFTNTFFQAAIDAGVQVQPLTIKYFRHGKTDRHAPYIRTMSFLGHFLKFARQPLSTVYIDVLEPISTTGMDRKQLSQQAHEAIANAHTIEPEATWRLSGKYTPACKQAG